MADDETEAERQPGCLGTGSERLVTHFGAESECKKWRTRSSLGNTLQYDSKTSKCTLGGKVVVDRFFPLISWAISPGYKRGGTQPLFGAKGLVLKAKGDGRALEYNVTVRTGKIQGDRIEGGFEYERSFVVSASHAEEYILPFDSFEARVPSARVSAQTDEGRSLQSFPPPPPPPWHLRKPVGSPPAASAPAGPAAPVSFTPLRGEDIRIIGFQISAYAADPTQTKEPKLILANDFDTTLANSEWPAYKWLKGASFSLELSYISAYRCDGKTAAAANQQQGASSASVYTTLGAGFATGATVLLFAVGFAASVWSPALRARRRGELELDCSVSSTKDRPIAVKSSEFMSM